MIRAALLLAVAEMVHAETTLTFTAQWQTGLFTLGNDVGPLNPHVYRPEEFSVNDLVYEGLVAWDADSPGQDGIMGTDDDYVVGSLATSWTTNYEDIEAGSGLATEYEITFTLASGVTFHDGEPWNAAAAALNFDHVMGRNGTTNHRAGFHDWYGLTTFMQSWEAVDELTFKVTFSSYYEAALRELTLIRPFRFISPAALPDITNYELSCNGWKPWANTVRTWGPHTCVGIKAPIGTGPYKFMGKQLTDSVTGATRVIGTYDLAAECSAEGGTTYRYLRCVYGDNEQVTELLFEKFADYTVTPTIVMPTYDNAVMKAYASTSEVKDALIDGTLDMAYGLNALSPSGFMSLVANDGGGVVAHIADHDLNTRFIGLHSGGALNTPSLRKMMMCLMDPARTLLYEGDLVEEEPLETLFDPTLPYMREAAPSLTSIAGLCAESASTSADIPAALTSCTDNCSPLRFLYPTGSTHVENIVYSLIGVLYTSGIAVTPMPMAKDDYNSILGAWAGSYAAMGPDDWPTWPLGNPVTDVEYDLAYSESWGPMYDPTTSLTDIAYAWPAEVWSDVTNYLDSISKSDLNDKIRGVSAIVSDTARQTEYDSIFNTLNDEAIFMPLTAKRNTAVTRAGISGFKFNPTEFGTASVVAALHPTPADAGDGDDDGLSTGGIIGIAIAGAVALIALLFIWRMVSLEKQGTPMFTTIGAAAGAPDKATA